MPSAFIWQIDMEPLHIRLMENGSYGSLFSYALVEMRYKQQQNKENPFFTIRNCNANMISPWHDIETAVSSSFSMKFNFNFQNIFKLFNCSTVEITLAGDQKWTSSSK